MSHQEIKNYLTAQKTPKEIARNLSLNLSDMENLKGGCVP